MGSPVSAVIANIYVEDFEEEALVSAPCTFKICKRFVDDVSRQSSLRTVSFSFPEKPQKNLHLTKTIYCCATMRQRAITD